MNDPHVPDAMNAQWLREAGVVGKVGSAHVDDLGTPIATSVTKKVAADQTPFLPFGVSAAASSNQTNRDGKPGNHFPVGPSANTQNIRPTSERPSLIGKLPFTTEPAPLLASRDSAGGQGQTLPRTVFPAPRPSMPRVSIIPGELAIPSTYRAARERHKLVVMLSCSGMTTNEICTATGYKSAAVGIILRSHNPELVQIRREFGSKVGRAIELSVYQKLQMLSFESVDRLGDHMRDTEDKTNSRHAAVAILDRAGHSPVKKQLTLGGNIPADELRALVSQLSQVDEVRERQSEWAIAPVGV